jgi:hypothetical protein
VHLVLIHTFDQPEEAPDYASGWHLCLGALIARLDGHDVPPVVGEVKLPGTTVGKLFAMSTPSC